MLGDEAHDREYQRKYLVLETARDFIIASLSNPQADTEDRNFVPKMVSLADHLLTTVDNIGEPHDKTTPQN